MNTKCLIKFFCNFYRDRIIELMYSRKRFVYIRIDTHFVTMFHTYMYTFHIS